MEQQLDEPHRTKLEVTITDLEAPDRIASGEIIDISQSGVCANLSMRLPLGAIVKARVGDCVMFGHVICCDAEQPFRTSIEVIRVLIGQSYQARLVNAILAETMPATPGVVISTTK
jgi:hypothetical protein